MAQAAGVNHQEGMGHYRPSARAYGAGALRLQLPLRWWPENSGKRGTRGDPRFWSSCVLHAVRNEKEDAREVMQPHLIGTWLPGLWWFLLFRFDKYGNRQKDCSL